MSDSSGKRKRQSMDHSLICGPSTSYNVAKHCILCFPRKKENFRISSTENGMEKIREAASIRKDSTVLERLRALHERGVESFFYHTDNQCYKSYVLKKTLDALKKSTENIVAPENLPAEVSTQGSSQPSSSMSTRSKASSERHPPCSATVSSREVERVIRCIICDQARCRGDYHKHRFSHDQSAREFLEATIFFDDEVKLRLADIISGDSILDSISRLKAKDIYYHSTCKRNYLNQYENSISQCVLCEENINRFMRADTNTVEELLDKSRITFKIDVAVRLLACFDENSKQFVRNCYVHEICKTNFLGISSQQSRKIYTEHILPLVNDMILNGYYLLLSEIRDELHECYPDLKFYNNRIKVFLIQHFGDKVSFCRPYKLNDSLVVYPSYLTTDQILAKIQNLNIAKTAGQMIRNAFKDVNFGLGDSFCDKDDLIDAWNNTRMPEVIVEFLSGLLNFSKAKLIKPHDFSSDNIGDDDDGDNESDGDESEETTKQDVNNKGFKKPCYKSILTQPKVVLANSLFQTLYYSVNRGRKKTPLHIMLAHTIYDKCKGKGLITSLNKLGFCISYTEYKRCRALLSAYTYIKGKNDHVPLPAQLGTKQFTLAAIDNFDHQDSSSISGKKANHDTVTVLFQNIDTENLNKRKQKISELGILYPDISMCDKLPCQKLQDYHHPQKGKSNVPLPSEFVALPNPQYEDDQKRLLISVARNVILPSDYFDRQHILIPEQNLIPSWAGAHALLTTSNLPLKKIGFLPVLPHPITKTETVYTVLVNLNSIALKLRQKILPFVCDEGVYHIIIDIYMHNPKIFQNTFAMLGTFHMAKAALRCAGKYLRGCGIEDGFIEKEVFGPKVVEAVLGGTHYYRSFKGLSIVEDAILHLKSDAFWLSHDPARYKEGLEQLCKLKFNLTEFDSLNAKQTIEGLMLTNTLRNFLEDFDNFSKECSQRSEMCLYFENYLCIINEIKNLIKADRTGDFLLHMKTVGELCNIFTGGDGVHYQRCASFYHEQLKGLQGKHPELYGQFLEGNFVVKTKEGTFNAVAGDMKLEQTIQRSSKSSHGIIGQTRSLNYVTQWQLIYHEVLGISNAFQELINPHDGESETKVHHELTKSKISELNSVTEKLYQFIHIRGNPYNCLKCPSTEVALTNLASQILAHSCVKEKLLKFHEMSKDKYEDFRTRVYVNKSSFLSDTITQFKLHRVDYLPETKDSDSKTVKQSEKEKKLARKMLNTAKTKYGQLQCVIKYDVTSYCSLFDGNYMTKTPQKSQLMAELEIYLTPESYKEVIPNDATLVVDFMSFVRTQVINAKNFGNFESLVTTLFNRFSSVCLNNVIHVIFDSYMPLSLKGPERESRGTSMLQLSRIESRTPIPQQVEKFWNSTKNKVMFQKYAAKQILILANECQKNIVISGVVIDGAKIACQHIQPGHGVINIDELTSSIEEADQRIIPHIYWSVQQGYHSFVVLSNDTDVLVLLLHYFKTFLRIGQVKVWLKVGTGVKQRFIPVHTLYNRLGPLRKVVLAAHIGTGCDYLSKVGTKLGALNAIPEKFLGGFGKGSCLSDDQIKAGELYLLNVLKPCAQENTLDELRCSQYLNNDTVFDLPPTSHSIIKGHIPRWYYIVKELSNLINPNYVPLNPLEYGWKEQDGELLPEKSLLLMPKNLYSSCNCIAKDITKRCNNRCSCKKSLTPCTGYCGCKANCCNNTSNIMV